MSAPQKGDVTDCFRCGGSGKAYPDGRCGHCAGTGKLTWVDYGHSQPGVVEEPPLMNTPWRVIENPTLAKLCEEDQSRLDRLEALIAKIAERLEIEP